MAFLQRLGALFRKGKTVYFPGCTTTAKMPHIAQNYEALLKAVGIPFITLKDTVCCGGFCLDGGYRNDFEKLRQKNMELFKDQQVTRIITSDPSCYHVFKDHYAIPVDYAPVVLKDIPFARSRTETVAYHDTCFLAHQANPIIEPRQLLEKKGFTVCTMQQACGAGGLLPLNNPALAKRIAARCLKSTPCQKIVTSCPLCYVHLKDSGDKEILELSEVLE